MKIPRRIAQTLINSLKGGVVPRVGLQYLLSKSNSDKRLMHCLVSKRFPIQAMLMMFFLSLSKLASLTILCSVSKSLLRMARRA